MNYQKQLLETAEQAIAVADTLADPMKLQSSDLSSAVSLMKTQLAQLKSEPKGLFEGSHVYDAYQLLNISNTHILQYQRENHSYQHTPDQHAIAAVRTAHLAMVNLVIEWQSMSKQ